MLARLLLMVFCALIILITTALTMKISDPNTTEDITDLTRSNSSILRLLEEEKEKKPTVVDFSAGEFNLRPPKPCECSANDLKQTLTSFKGPDPPFLPAYCGSKAQTIKFPDQIPDSAACRRAQGTSMCGRLSYTFTDLESCLEIPNFPYKGIFWDASMNQLTLQPQKTDPTGLQKVLITAYMPSFKDVFETAEIAYFVHPAPEELPQNAEKPEPPETGKPRRILSPGQGFCTNPTTMLNLFNTAALAEQSSFWPGNSSTASAGCDGEIMMIDRATYAWDNTKLITSEFLGTTIAPQFWKITFSQPTSIKTILLTNRDDCCTDRFPFYAATVGNDPDPTQNPFCVPLGAMNDGGWYLCPNSMIGTIFGVYSNTEFLNFLEVMAYSQEAIHFNAGITTSVLGTNQVDYPASDAIQKIVVVKADDTIRKKCVLIVPPAGGLATQIIKFQAQTLIKAIVLFPGYMLSETFWPTHEISVAIYGKTVGGTQQLCGVTGDYYATTYYEVACNIQANQIILEQQNPDNSLRYCGFGALADCDCGKSSFDRLLFTTPPATPFASTTQILVQSTDGVQQIQFNLQTPDTVSSVCGNADGFSKCGTRQLSFKDKLTGFEIPQWPYKGISFDALTSKLTLDSAQADVESVITVTISLQNYPAVFMSQDITAVVYGGKTATIVTESKKAVTVTKGLQNFKPCIPSQLLDATINEEAQLELPALTETSYSVTSKQDFAATFEGNKLNILSQSELDVGTKYLQVSFDSPTQNCTFKIQINFKSTKTDLKMTEILLATTKTSENEQGSLIKAIDSSEAAETGNLQIITHPKVEISEVDVQGRLTFTFSEAQEFNVLFNSSYSRQSEDAGVGNKVADIRSKYLLSDKELKITVISGGEVDDSKLQLDWYASDITDTDITIQLIFKNPNYISIEIGCPETLRIEFLQESLKVFKSKKSGQSILEPLQIQQRILPVQAEFGPPTDFINLVGQAFGQTATALVVLSFVAGSLKGLIDKMWTMVSALQIQMTFPYTKVPMHAWVYVFMLNVIKIAQYDYFQSEYLISAVFTFENTQSPGSGFSVMGITSSRLVTFIASILTYQFFLIVLIILWAMCFFCPSSQFMKRFQVKLGKMLFLDSILVLLVQSTQEMATGTFLSVEDMKYSHASDGFDSVYTVITLKLLCVLAVAPYLYLKQHKDSLNEPWFQKKYGSLTKGLRVENESVRVVISIYVQWFIWRRILQALIVVKLRNFTVWFQLTANMLLQLVDICVKISLSPHSDPFLRIMEIFNDFIGYCLAILLYFFTNLNMHPESRKVVGWCYNGLTMLMFAVNLCVLAWAGLVASIDKIKLCVIHRQNRVRLQQSLFQRITRVVGISDLFQEELNDNGKMIQMAVQSMKQANLEVNQDNEAPKIPQNGEGRVHPAIDVSVVELALNLRGRLIIEAEPEQSNHKQQSSESSYESEEESGELSEVIEQSEPNQASREQIQQIPQQAIEEKMVLREELKIQEHLITFGGPKIFSPQLQQPAITLQQQYAHAGPYVAKQLQRREQLIRSLPRQEARSGGPVSLVYGGVNGYPRLPRYVPQGPFHDSKHRYASQDQGQLSFVQSLAQQQIKPLPGNTAQPKVAALAEKRKAQNSQVVMNHYPMIFRK